MRALMARVKAGTWAVFHVIIPCNCRYMALPNKEQKNWTQLLRKTSLKQSSLTHIACDGRRPPTYAISPDASAFCIHIYYLSFVKACCSFFLDCLHAYNTSSWVKSRRSRLWDIVENLYGSDIWIRLFQAESCERTTAHVGIPELMRHSLVESTAPTLRMNYECAK